MVDVELKGCSKCIKYTLFSLNLLFWLLGAATLAIGIWVRADPNMGDLLSKAEGFAYVYAGSYVLIVMGIVLVVVCFFGCCGAYKDSVVFLAIYFICVTLIAATLLVGCAWQARNRDTLMKPFEKRIIQGVEGYYTNDKEKIFMDTLQKNLGCCGATNGTADYLDRGVAVPASCASDTTDRPCSPVLLSLVSRRVRAVAAIGLILALCLVAGMLFSMWQICAIRRAGKAV